MIARMTATVLLQLLLLPLAMGKASPPPPWKAPSPGDRRGPCPMMNSLANHGLIPHSGLNVSGDELRAGFVAGTNVDSPVLDGFIRAALSVSTTGVPGTLNLDDLASPVTEHDGSLSRPDRHGGGDVLAFNASVWAETIAGHFAGPVVTLEQAAAARAHRLCAAAAANPEFHLSDLQMELSFTETTIYMLFMGRGTQGTARRDFVKSKSASHILKGGPGLTKSSPGNKSRGSWQDSKRQPRSLAHPRGSRRTVNRNSARWSNPHMNFHFLHVQAGTGSTL
ncbi:hypothetical protein RB594_008718 [Gaeumannomyces avenae]